MAACDRGSQYEQEQQEAVKRWCHEAVYRWKTVTIRTEWFLVNNNGKTTTEHTEAQSTQRRARHRHTARATGFPFDALACTSSAALCDLRASVRSVVGLLTCNAPN